MAGKWEYEIAVATIEPKLQLPIANAVKGCAQMLLIRGASNTEIRQRIATQLKAMRSTHNPFIHVCMGIWTANKAGGRKRIARIHIE